MPLPKIYPSLTTAGTGDYNNPDRRDLTPAGVPWAEVLRRFPVSSDGDGYGNPGAAEDTAELPPVAQAPQSPPVQQQAPQPQQPASSLPSAPPSTRINTNPFSKENRQQTLLNIAAAFGGSQDFASGMGSAASAISGRIGDLKNQAKKQVSYGGPNGQFEIVTNPDGSRSYRMVPEFQQAIQAANAARGALDDKGQIDARASALRGVLHMPQDQRAQAYAGILSSPQAYGFDTSHMPAAWDERYATIASGMGQTVNQANTADYRTAALEARQQAEAARQQVAASRLKLQQERKTKGSGRLAANVPAGFFLSN